MGSSTIYSRLDRLSVTRFHYKLLLIHGFGWMFDAMDVGIITFVLAVVAAAWRLSPVEVGLIGSAGLAGLFVGAAISGIISDYLGRKTVFQLTLLIYSIFSLLTAFSWNVSSMAVLRFFVGIGLGGELPVVSSLLSEFIPSQSRGRFITLLESFWAYGWLLAAIVSFLVIPRYGWPLAFIVGAAPAFFVWVIRRNLPESPRWLAAKGRVREAEAVVAQIESRAPVRSDIKPYAQPAAGTALGGRRVFTFKELWSSQYVRRTVMLWMLWFGITFGYYGIFIWLPTLLVRAGFRVVTSFYYVIIITLAQIPGYFSAAYLVERIGRKAVLAIYLVLSALAALLFGRSLSVNEILLWGSLMSFFNLGAWGATYAYTPEQYPTLVRGTGAGCAAAFGRIGGIIAPLLVGMLLPIVQVSGVFAVNAIMFLIGAAAVAILGVETKGKSLEELSAEISGQSQLSK